MAKQFKVMDSYFERPDGAYAWASNRSSNKGYNAVLDHILVSKELWGEVVTCGVHIPHVRWNTDHTRENVGTPRGVLTVVWEVPTVVPTVLSASTPHINH